jgi:predicted acetyltransferase
VNQVNLPPHQVMLPDGTLAKRVPSTDLWWVEGSEFLGSVGIRHELNDLLERWGGHIGYAVRPSARLQGHAAAMLAGALDYVRANLPLTRVMLTVNETNTGSIRVIEKNGGVLRDEVDNPWVEGMRGRRYWIEL